MALKSFLFEAEDRKSEISKRWERLHSRLLRGTRKSFGWPVLTVNVKPEVVGEEYFSGRGDVFTGPSVDSSLAMKTATPFSKALKPFSYSLIPESVTNQATLFKVGS